MKASAVAERVQEMVIYLFYEHDKFDFCQQLIKILQEAFAEVAEISDALAEDARKLAEIAWQRERTHVETLKGRGRRNCGPPLIQNSPNLS